MRLLIADDHTLFRESLRSLLEARGHEVIGEARNGTEAVELCRSLAPDVVLMDLDMPEMGGIEATREILGDQPDLRIVIVTGSTENGNLLHVLRAGARGYLLKDLEAAIFFDLLEGVMEGRPALPDGMSQKILLELATGPKPRERQGPDTLTDRELEVLKIMAAGITSNRSLARYLGVSENTVKFHVRNILEKLRLHDRAQAISHALRNGLVELDGIS